MELKKSWSKKKNTVCIAGIVPVILLLLLALGYYSSQNWHSLAVKQGSVSFSLHSFEREFFEDKTCFLLEQSASDLENKETEPINVSVNGITVISEELELKENQRKEYCFGTESLKAENFVEIHAGQNNLFFHLKKGTPGPKANQVVSFTDTPVSVKGSRSFVEFKVIEWSADYTPIEIFVNKEFHHRIYPNQEKKKFVEEINLDEGENKIGLFFGSEKISTEFNYKKPFTLRPWAGFFLLALSVFVFLGFVYPNRALPESLALSISSIIASFILISFVLNFFSSLSTFSFVSVFLTELLAFALFFRKKFSLQKIPLKLNLKTIEIVLILFLFFLTFLIPFIMASHQTAWSVYYERHAESVAESFSIPRTDELSYLGRNFTFTPGYFLFEGGLTWITGANATQLFALTITLSNIFLVSSALFLASKMGMSRKTSALFVMFLAMGSFIFSAMLYTPRHAIALSFLLVSVALAIDKKEFKSAFFLGIASIIQVPTLVFFAFLYPALSKKIYPKRLAKIMLLSLIVLVPLYVYIPLINGLPNQAMQNTWGYRIMMPPQLLLQELGIMLLFFVSFMLIEVYRWKIGKSIWDNYRKRLLAASIVSILLQMVLSTRFNLTSAVALAAFLAYSLEPHKKEINRTASVLFGAVLLIGFTIAVLASAQLMFSQNLLDSTEFLEENTSSTDRILADPYYGHIIAFESNRVTLADLMVEYADEEKLSDAYSFLSEKDYSILKKYEISAVFTGNNQIKASIAADFMQNKSEPKKPIEFRELNKVFTNKEFSVHRKR